MSNWGQRTGMRESAEVDKCKNSQNKETEKITWGEDFSWENNQIWFSWKIYYFGTINFDTSLVLLFLFLHLLNQFPCKIGYCCVPSILIKKFHIALLSLNWASNGKYANIFEFYKPVSVFLRLLLGSMKIKHGSILFKLRIKGQVCREYAQLEECENAKVEQEADLKNSNGKVKRFELKNSNRKTKRFKLTKRMQNENIDNIRLSTSNKPTQQIKIKEFNY